MAATGGRGKRSRARQVRRVVVRASHEPRVVVWISLGIVAAAVLVSLALGPGRRASGTLTERFGRALALGDERAARGVLESALDQGAERMFDLVRMVEWAGMLTAHASDAAPADAGPASIPVEALVAGSRLGEDDRRLLLACHRAASAPRDGPGADLEELAGRTPPLRHANEAVGRAELRRGRRDAALGAFHREASAFAEADEAREREVAILVGLDAYGRLERLMQDPAYAAAAGPAVRFRLAFRRGAWREAARWYGPMSCEGAGASVVLLAGAGGLLWFGLSLLMGRVRLVPCSARFWLCVAAVGLGAASTVPAVVLGLWGEQTLGLRETGDLVRDIAFYLGGVGFKEQLCKLLLFLPLVPVLLRRGDELEMLVVAGCVGLGFALEENVGYVRAGGSTAALARFLTANFLHVASTGLCGLALCRAIRWPRWGVSEFFSTFLVVFALHGAYDALLSLRGLGEVSVLYLTAYAWLAHRHLGVLRELRGPGEARPGSISLAGAFAVGISALMALAYGVLAWEIGMRLAAQAISLSVLGQGALVYLFVRELGEFR